MDRAGIVCSALDFAAYALRVHRFQTDRGSIMEPLYLMIGKLSRFLKDIGREEDEEKLYDLDHRFNPKYEGKWCGGLINPEKFLLKVKDFLSGDLELEEFVNVSERMSKDLLDLAKASSASGISNRVWEEMLSLIKSRANLGAPITPDTCLTIEALKDESRIDDMLAELQLLYLELIILGKNENAGEIKELCRKVYSRCVDFARAYRLAHPSAIPENIDEYKIHDNKKLEFAHANLSLSYLLHEWDNEYIDKCLEDPLVYYDTERLIPVMSSLVAIYNWLEGGGKVEDRNPQSADLKILQASREEDNIRRVLNDLRVAFSEAFLFGTERSLKEVNDLSKLLYDRYLEFAGKYLGIAFASRYSDNIEDTAEEVCEYGIDLRHRHRDLRFIPIVAIWPMKFTVSGELETDEDYVDEQEYFDDYFDEVMSTAALLHRWSKVKLEELNEPRPVVGGR